MSTLIEKIENAESKDDLEALGVEHLGVNVDKRKGIETIRAELLELAEAKATEERVSVEEEVQAAQDVQPQPATQPEPEPPKYRGRMLQHTKNGRLFPWTPALAKSRYLKEV